MLASFRRKLRAMIGGFEGGLYSRLLKDFQASRALMSVLVQQSGDDMTARARFLTRNNGYAINAVESWVSNLVGTGIKPSLKLQITPCKTRYSSSVNSDALKKAKHEQLAALGIAVREAV